MASRKFKLPGFSEYLEEVTQVTAKEAATRIVGELQFLSPWYSGEFATNWVVRVGDVANLTDPEKAPSPREPSVVTNEAAARRDVERLHGRERCLARPAGSHGEVRPHSMGGRTVRGLGGAVGSG